MSAEAKALDTPLVLTVPKVAKMLKCRQETVRNRRISYAGLVRYVQRMSGIEEIPADPATNSKLPR